MSALISLLILVIVFGLIWWIITTLLPLPAPFLTIAQVIMALILIILLLGHLGGFISLPDWR